MREINFKKQDLNNLTLYNRGGIEGVIYIYSNDLLLKAFEPYIKRFINIEVKKLKLIQLHEKNIPEHIMVKPNKLVKLEGEFFGYTMPKITDSIRIDCINDYRKIVKAYRMLFQNLELLHENDITINDVKPDNILYDKNQNPVLVDIDSMGVGEFPPNHPNMRSQIFRKVDNYYQKMRENDSQTLDKLKLLACFVQSLERKSYVDNQEASIYDDRPLLDILNEANLSDDFKTYITDILTKTADLEQALTNTEQVFLEEEMSMRKRR